MPTKKTEPPKKSHVIKTVSISTKANEVFEAKYEELVKYAEAKGQKKPEKGNLLSKMIEGSAKLKPSEILGY